MEIASKKGKLLEQFPTRHDEARLLSLEQEHLCRASGPTLLERVGEDGVDFFPSLLYSADGGNELPQAQRV